MADTGKAAILEESVPRKIQYFKPQTAVGGPRVSAEGKGKRLMESWDDEGWSNAIYTLLLLGFAMN